MRVRVPGPQGGQGSPKWAWACQEVRLYRLATTSPWAKLPGLRLCQGARGGETLPALLALRSHTGPRGPRPRGARPGEREHLPRGGAGLRPGLRRGCAGTRAPRGPGAGRGPRPSRKPRPSAGRSRLSAGGPGPRPRLGRGAGQGRKRRPPGLTCAHLGPPAPSCRLRGTRGRLGGASPARARRRPGAPAPRPGRTRPAPARRRPRPAARARAPRGGRGGRSGERRGGPGRRRARAGPGGGAGAGGGGGAPSPDLPAAALRKPCPVAGHHGNGTAEFRGRRAARRTPARERATTCRPAAGRPRPRPPPGVRPRAPRAPRSPPPPRPAPRAQARSGPGRPRAGEFGVADV